MSIWAAALLLTAIAIVAAGFVVSRKRHKTVVLGQQLAAARARDAARQATGSLGPSPLPEGRYDQEGGDYDLTAVVERPLDRQLQGAVRTFTTAASEARAAMRQRISMDEQYTLIHFAKRYSVLALQERSAARCGDALAALAMIDETRIDPRDAAWAVGLIAHAIDAIGADREQLKRQAIAQATPKMGKILDGVSEGSPLSEWGYRETRSPNGLLGLVRSGAARYDPTLNMNGLGFGLAAALERRRYIAELELAVELPVVWFEKAHRARVEQMLKRSRAGISVSGFLRREYTSDASAQQFTEWVIEMPTREEATALVGYAGTAAHGSRHVKSAAAAGRLFALVVAGSSMDGVAPFESAESLEPILGDIRRLLEDAIR